MFSSKHRLTRAKVAFVSLLCLTNGCGDFDAPARFRESVNDPGGDFTTHTGLTFPEFAKVLSVDDTHGGFHGDGEFHLVFEIDEETLNRWLQTPPPWEAGEWQSGPVPHEIGFHCGFGTSGVGYASINNGPTEYIGDSELKCLLSSSEIWYIAKERGSSSIAWHNGSLLILDPKSNEVWLSVWDF